MGKDTNFEFKVNSVFLVVGPSGAGKTTFFKKHLIPKLNEQYGDLNIQYLSSDDIRKELLGDVTISKMDKRMMHVSKQAFDILDTKFQAVISYPVNADFVVVDTTGLNKEFREDIIRKAKFQNYNVYCIMFDYKNRQDYYEHLTLDEESKRLTSNQLDKMRKEVIREINKKDFTEIYRVKDKEFDKVTFSISDHEQHRKQFLPKEFEYVIVSDIHGCYDELIQLLQKNGFSIDDNGKLSHSREEKRVLLVGDLVDKNSHENIRKVIEFCYNNLEWMYMVRGNHENFVYKALTGQLDPKIMPSQEFIDEYFDSIPLFESDEELKNKFYEICNRMVDCYFGSNFVVTHAPCQNKNIGKLDSRSAKAQRTFVYPKKRDFEDDDTYLEACEKAFEFVRKESNGSQPVHVFGHVSIKNVYQRFNKIAIDTGCYAGGQLTSVIITSGGRKMFEHVKSSFDKKEELLDLFERTTKEINLDELETKEKGRIFWAAENKVNFISGTVSPADRFIVKNEDGKTIDFEKSSLESLEQGLNYYKRAGIEKVVLQKKFMGSRANIYLFKEPEKNYTTTRNGYTVKQIDLTEAYKPLYELNYVKDAFNNKNAELIIIDAELVPWGAIGRGLIERDFISFEKGFKSEIDYLKDNGFFEAFDKIYNGEYTTSNYEKLSFKESKEKMIELFGDTKSRTFRAIREFKRQFISADVQEEKLKVFSRQMELFAKDGEVHFKPFSLMKVVYQDGTEETFFEDNNENVFRNVNEEDEYCVVDFSEADYLEKATTFYTKIAFLEEMEGIMIKPYIVYSRGVAPCIKVRNPGYLTIVYGPDYTFTNKLKKLMEKKSIKNKIRTSIKEFEIGKKLLEIPYNDISKTNNEYMKLMASMIMEERNEKVLDPRL